jgi:stage V sporulation protein G
VRITEVRIKLTENSEDRLRGFCSITFDDCFVVRDLKIIEGNNGPFVAMPSRKLSSHCGKCGTKNHLRARFCNQCGGRQIVENIPHDNTGRARLYADIAHPVNASCREMIQNRVIEEFQKELELSRQPGYVSRYDEDYASDWGPEDVETVSRAESAAPRRADLPHVGGTTSGPHKATGESSEAVKKEGADGFGDEIH